jgi:hypothetical protein
MAENKTAKTPTDSGVGFIDGVWYGPGPTAWQCQCGKAYTVTCISSKPPKREWVGLTEREIELIDEMIETQLLHAERCDHMANSTMAQKQKAWDLERVELLRKLKERNG